MSEWILPTQATIEGYYWRRMADGRGTPSIVKVVLWKSGWLDGPDKPWREEFLAECFGSMSMSFSLSELERRGELLLKIEAPTSPKEENEPDGDYIYVLIPPESDEFEFEWTDDTISDRAAALRVASERNDELVLEMEDEDGEVMLKAPEPIYPPLPPGEYWTVGVYRFETILDPYGE